MLLLQIEEKYQPHKEKQSWLTVGMSRASYQRDRRANSCINAFQKIDVDGRGQRRRRANRSGIV